MECKILNIKIIYATRYGSTKDVAEHIADALKRGGCDVVVSDVSSAELCGADAYILGSGIYANKLLPDMEKFIADHSDELADLKVGLFGVAMRTEAVERRGRMSGGTLIFDRYPVKPFIKAMLHGRMDFSILTEKDRGGLERFYEKIGLSEEQKAEKRKLRDEISVKECGNCADDIIAILTVDV